MPVYHVAQVNIGRVKAPVEDPLMAAFVARLDEINALADHSPGFVWRLQTPVGNATYFRPYPEDDRILINMSVWESIAGLRYYVYKTAHAELLGSGKRGSRSSRALTPPCGGCRPDTVPAWTKRPNVLPIWRSMAPLSSPSLSKRHSSRTTDFSKGSIGRRSCPVRRDSQRTDRIQR